VTNNFPWATRGENRRDQIRRGTLAPLAHQKVRLLAERGPRPSLRATPYDACFRATPTWPLCLLRKVSLGEKSPVPDAPRSIMNQAGSTFRDSRGFRCNSGSRRSPRRRCRATLEHLHLLVQGGAACLEPEPKATAHGENQLSRCSTPSRSATRAPTLSRSQRVTAQPSSQTRSHRIKKPNGARFLFRIEQDGMLSNPTGWVRFGFWTMNLGAQEACVMAAMQPIDRTPINRC
jgi:hypothetical protein